MLNATTGGGAASAHMRPPKENFPAPSAGSLRALRVRTSSPRKRRVNAPVYQAVYEKNRNTKSWRAMAESASTVLRDWARRKSARISLSSARCATSSHQYCSSCPDRRSKQLATMAGEDKPCGGFRLLDLPQELVAHAVQYADVRSLVDIMCTCRSLWSLAPYYRLDVIVGSSGSDALARCMYRGARDGNINAMRVLLADRRVSCMAGGPALSPLPIASWNGHAEAVKMLLQHAQSTEDLNTAVMRASLCGHSEILSLLLADGRCDPAASENAPIRFATMGGHAEAAKLLLRISACDPSTQDSDALRFVCTKGHADMARLLLADGRCDPTAENSAALRLAAEYGHADIVAMLLRDGRSDAGAAQNEAVRLACLGGHTAVVSHLLRDARCDPTAHDNAAVVIAAARGHCDVVKLLVNDGRVDPRARDDGPMRYAALSGHESVVALLLAETHSDPSARENGALRAACKNGHESVVRALLADPRCDVCCRDFEAVRLACASGHWDVLKLLLLHLRAIGARAGDITAPFQLTSCAHAPDLSIATTFKL